MERGCGAYGCERWRSTRGKPAGNPACPAVGYSRPRMLLLLFRKCRELKSNCAGRETGQTDRGQ